MKSISIIVLILPSILGFTGCDDARKKSSNTENTEMVSITEAPQSKTIEMAIIPEIYDTVPEKVSLKIINNTPSDIEFGAMYEIEKYIGDSWKPVEFTDGLAFIDILYSIGQGQSESYDIYIYPDMVKYEPGKYRVCKIITAGESRKSYYADFEITGK